MQYRPRDQSFSVKTSVGTGSLNQQEAGSVKVPGNILGSGPGVFYNSEVLPYAFLFHVLPYACNMLILTYLNPEYID